MKALAPVYSCSKKCWVKGRKTVVDNTDKLEKAGTPYVRRVTLVPLVRPGVRAGPQSRQGHLCVVVKMCARCWSSYSTSRIGYNECCVEGVILL